jgi:hypothetical protein
LYASIGSIIGRVEFYEVAIDLVDKWFERSINGAHPVPQETLVSFARR